MQNEKMYRFLESIGIRDPERFDMDFDLVGRDPQNKKIIHMSINKKTPWDAEMLDEFKGALANITSYQYEMRFTYSTPPSFEDVDAIFADWHFSNYHKLPSFQLCQGEDNRIFVFLNEEEEKDPTIKGIIDDFKAFLAFLSYDFSIEILRNEKKEAPNKEEEEPSQGMDEECSIGETEESSSDSFEDPSSNDDEVDEDEIRLRESLKQAEEAYLDSLRAERNERQRKNVFAKGDYTKLMHIGDVFTTPYSHVEIEGEIFGIDKKTPFRKTRKGLLSMMCGLGDLDDQSAVDLRLFESRSGLKAEEIMALAKENGKRARVRGAIEEDKHTLAKQIYVHFIEIVDSKPMREDHEPIKRVELHLHTKMSAMDGLGDAGRYIDLAVHMGMKAMAITDHGVIQSFPIAETHLKSLKKKDPDLDFKILYGIEFYAFHKPKFIYNPRPISLKKAKYCVLDFETTGLSSLYDRPTEFGAVHVDSGMVRNTFDTFINAGVPIPKAIQEKTHITDEMIADAPSEKEALAKIMSFIGDEDTILVAHNAPFDVGFLNAMRARAGLGPLTNPVIDTLALSHWLRPTSTRHNLGALSRDLKLDIYDEDKAHRADFDANALNSVWQVMIPLICNKLGKQEANAMDLVDVPFEDPGIYRSLKCDHLCALAKNQAGIKDLYKLVSKSETAYMALGSTPRLDYEDLNKLRQNILIGSACFNGTVFRTASEYDNGKLEEAMRFFDYIELQPIEQYRFLVKMGELDEDRLLKILKNIVETADRLQIPICATGDCHYVEPDEKITRDIYINQKGLGGTNHPLMPYSRQRMQDDGHFFENADQHFFSTKEMLDSFRSWLPEDKCQEIVVTNTNMIASLCDKDIKILKDRLCTPDANLPKSDEKLRAICYENLRKRYGENPDPIVKARLEKELDGIIGNGYSVTYYIAHLLIKWANSKGFFVGSRGSVGSSFAANVAGITEVNPLNPHYLCKHCHHFEWADNSVYRSGFDLPFKKCPECGEEMARDGQSIPFETFLGFNAEKVPDIDLNFPQDHLDEAHNETRVLLSTKEENEAYAQGRSVESPHVIRAGTITTAETKNAFGYVKGYFEKVLHKEVDKNSRAYVGYLASKCTEVKRSTGQHPGGIVVIPADMDIFDFAPYQYPSDDPTKGWLTTHYEFASMHDSVLKLDELGHLDPMALRMMHEATGVDFRNIPFDDKKVLSLFTGIKALKLQKNYLGLKIGITALPEFGTNFVQGLVEEAKPTTFNDLLIISGLSHGTNVWNDNAQLLIRQGKVLDQVIGCRDDIMNYLLLQHVDSSIAFRIMEDVRKNKPLKPEYEKEMIDHGVPDWYIDSCHKIQYLFPRAHATAYVMAAFRIAWYKVYYPLAFYAVYFSTRCDKFDIAKMTLEGPELLKVINEMRSLSAAKQLSDTDEEVLKGLIVALEMVDRGYKIENVSIMKSDAKYWSIDKENNAIVPPFTVIPNFGASAAEGIVNARKKGGEFLSKEDLIERVRSTPGPNGETYSIGSSVIDALDAVGATKGLNETNQMSLFDF